jgi:AcrR family transcriptional regulator
MPKASQKRPQRLTRGGHAPTGTSAKRRAKASSGASAKGERTRIAIIAAARAVFERDGYFDVRVSDIVREAGVAHGSYYTYFASKKEVFLAVADDVSREIDIAVGHAESDPSGEPLTSLLNANARYFAVQRRNNKLMNLIEQVSTDDADLHAHRIADRRRHVDRVAEILTRMQRRGLAHIDGNVHTTAGALIAMLQSVAHWSSVCPDEYSAVEETVTMIWARAIGLEASATGSSRNGRPARQARHPALSHRAP